MYFNSFGVEYISQRELTKIKDRYIAYNIFSIQDDNSIIYGFYYIAFIKYMIAEKTLLD